MVNPWIRVAVDVYIGDLKPLPYAEEFDAVVTLHPEPLAVDDEVSHFHVRTPPGQLNLPEHTGKAVAWLLPRWDRRCLIRSSPYTHAALVATALLVQLGATHDDAYDLISNVLRPDLLPRWAVLEHLEALEVADA